LVAGGFVVILRGITLSLSKVGSSFRLPFAVSLCLFALLPRCGDAQASPAHSQATPESVLEEFSSITSTANASDLGPAGIIPFVKGFNASLGVSWQHDSSNGWSTLLSPNAAYRFNQYVSLDVGVPLYFYINIYSNVGTKAKPDYKYAARNGVFGDTSLSLRADVPLAPGLDYGATVSMGLPTGNTNFGLSAGQVTYDLNNHFERTFRMFTPDVEFGEGNGSALVDPRVRKDYISVGPIAHFQAGSAVELPIRMTFEADAYEVLPLKPDLIYSTTGKGKKQVTTTTNIGPAEDNGFLTSLDIPVTDHVTLSGFYTRSLRDHDDVAGFSFTFLLKAPPRLEATR
jgi:hypothetical protein